LMEHSTREPFVQVVVENDNAKGCCVTVAMTVHGAECVLIEREGCRRGFRDGLPWGV
jgi:hypothetical protein